MNLQDTLDRYGLVLDEEDDLMDEETGEVVSNIKTLEEPEAIKYIEENFGQ